MMQQTEPCTALFQLVMQYLYCGGTESLHIRNTEVMEVRRDLTKSCRATRISISNPEPCASFCVAVLFPAAPLCSQILPARGPSETLWDHLLQEHHHRNLRGPLQTRQGEARAANQWHYSTVDQMATCAWITTWLCSSPQLHTGFRVS